MNRTDEPNVLGVATNLLDMSYSKYLTHHV
jgi:hypothetical protein